MGLGFKRALITVIVFIFLVSGATPALANQSDCTDLLILFARGSGQNNLPIIKFDKYNNAELYSNEAQSVKFFDEINNRVTGVTKEFVSLHNFEGRYNQYGYKAVAVDDGMKHKATHRTDSGNLYYESVKDGAEELAWYLEDKMTSCPLQQVVLGGYSQGAQVVGDALVMLPAQFRARIAYTAFYGDPKFNSRLTNSPTFKTGYWVRGSVSGSQTGSLGARADYVPVGLGNVGSWCDKEDPVCSARSAFKNPIKRFVADYFSSHVHSTVYQEKWIPQSANEIANVLKSRLPNGTTKTQVWLNKSDKSYQMDIALVLDGSGSMVTQLANIKAKLSAFVTSLYGVNWDTRVAVVAYDDDPAIHAAYLSKVLAGFTTDRPTITKAINDFQVDTYPHDIQEAMYSGIMTAFNDLQWRTGAQKKTIVITDAPAKDPDPGPNHWTKEQVAKRALELDPVSVSFVSLPAANQYQSWLNRVTDYLATQTNGTTKMGTYSYSVSDITGLLDAVTYQPVAVLDGDTTGYINLPVAITAGGSYDPDSFISSYDWDCNNDGVFEATTTEANYSCTYSAPYSGYIVSKVTSADGGSAKAIWQVSVTSGTSAPITMLATPQPTAERTSETSATIHILNSYPEQTLLASYSESGEILELYPASSEIVLDDIDQSSFTVYMSALNSDTESDKTSVLVPAYVPPPGPVEPVTDTPNESTKTIIESESNPQWLLDLTAQKQVELNARLAASIAATAALALAEQQDNPQATTTNNNVVSEPTTPSTVVAGATTTTKTISPASTAPTYTKQTPEFMVMAIALGLLSTGALLVLLKLIKKER